VLRELREDGLVTFQEGKVTFGDFDGMVAFSEFDRHYLDHHGPLMTGPGGSPSAVQVLTGMTSSQGRRGSGASAGPSSRSYGRFCRRNVQPEQDSRR
jgi:hypothetical protein